MVKPHVFTGGNGWTSGVERSSRPLMASMASRIDSASSDRRVYRQYQRLAGSVFKLVASSSLLS